MQPVVPPAWFHDQGLRQLMGTIRYPKAAHHVQKIVGKLGAGKPHVRVERGWENRAAQRHRRPNYQWSYPDVLAAITATR